MTASSLWSSSAGSPGSGWASRSRRCPAGTSSRSAGRESWLIGSRPTRPSFRNRGARRARLRDRDATICAAGALGRPRRGVPLVVPRRQLAPAPRAPRPARRVPHLRAPPARSESPMLACRFWVRSSVPDSIGSWLMFWASSTRGRPDGAVQGQLPPRTRARDPAGS